MTAPLQTDVDTTTSSTVDTASGRRKTVVELLGFDRFSGIYVLVLLVGIFGVTTGETFLTMTTFRGLLSDQAVTAIVSIGLLIAFAAGAFDLSVAATLGWSVVLSIWLQAEQGLGPWPSILITIVIGSLIGAVNGFVVVKMKVNSFIATLGMSSILAAAIQWISGGRQISSTGVSEAFTDLGRWKVFGFPIPIFYMFVVVIVAWYVLEHTPVGRYLYATGDNTEAARLAGIRTPRYLFGSLVAAATIAALAGLVFSAKVGAASLTAGPPYLLPAFAAVFLGSTQIKPGRVNVWGTVVAIFMLATGVKGLQLLGAPLWVDSLFNGVVLIVSVALAGLRTRGRQD